ncbi:MAG: PLP-dependent aminotransferase family protein [Oscillospiraceae bacterium]
MENIIINFTNSTPLYYQIYTAIIEQMRKGTVKGGDKLPSKRRLSEELSVSVNTIDTAYQMLVAEGYANARAKSGFYACSLAAPIAPARKAIVSCKKPPALPVKYDFTTSGIDTSLFPFKVWSRIQRDILYTHPELLNHGERQGDANLREAICTYLREYRGAVCSCEQIIIGAGIEYLLSLLARFFADSSIAVEDPGYTRAERVLRANGVNTVYLPLDKSGLSFDALQASCAKCAYITPSHQFPSGITMPIKRRQELLQWAQAKDDRYLIEDDYDSEFRFDSRPVPSLQGLDLNDKVVYIGTFSKSIAPSIRIGYMVLPYSLLARYNSEFSFYSSTVSRFEQQTLCRFIEDGHFARHLNRLRCAYRLRRDVLVRELQSAFGDNVTISGAHTGLHLLASFSPDFLKDKNEALLIKAALDASVRVSGLSSYYHNADTYRSRLTLVLGYSALNETELTSAVRTLAKIF